MTTTWEKTIILSLINNAREHFSSICMHYWKNLTYILNMVNHKQEVTFLLLITWFIIKLLHKTIICK